MPKTPSTKLFDLIKSLSGSEKRYFKLFVTNHKGDRTSKYALLFDAIDAQEEYDDEALKKLIYEGKPIQSRKYSELKAYLYELILKSLQGYDEKTSVDFKIKGFLQAIRVLYKRSHYEACKEILHKAKKTAYEHEHFASIIEVLSWEKQVAYAQMDISFLDAELERIDREETTCLEQLSNLSHYKNIFYRIIVSIRKDALLRSEEKVNRLKKIMNDPLLANIRHAQSIQARLFYYRIFSLYYYSVLEYEKFYHMNKKALFLMEENQNLLSEQTSIYISVLSNFVLSCGLLKKYGELEKSLEKFQIIKPKTIEDELVIFKQYSSAKLHLCIDAGDFEEGILALKQHMKEAKKFDQRSFERGSFYFLYFYIYFGAGDYDQALIYLNQWLNLPRSIERQDLQSLARILNLIVHFEMGNTLLLEYLFRSTYRFLRKRNRMYDFEKRVLNFIKDAYKIHSKKELQTAFSQLKKDFEAIRQTSAGKVMFQYFDFTAWLESKINGESFAAVVRRRYKEKLRKD